MMSKLLFVSVSNSNDKYKLAETISVDVTFFFAVHLGLRVSLSGPTELLDPQLLLSLYKEVSRLPRLFKGIWVCIQIQNIKWAIEIPDNSFSVVISRAATAFPRGIR